MERSYQSFQAPAGMVIQIGTSDSAGNEKPGSRHFLNLNGIQPMTGPYGSPVGDPVDITIALTPRQVAQVVRHFFVEVLYTHSICSQLFQRIMNKRWNVMTASEYKTLELDQDGFREMHYHRELI